MPGKNGLSSIAEIIEDAKQGKMCILVDDENRENEGDLIIPAVHANAEAINFMAKYGRGLICLALNGSRVKELQLPLMAKSNESRHQTAFTVSIEAREGISTGISAADRARTVKVAIDEKMGARDIVSPGHIFPLAAKDGGVLVRAGHTEAAVDLARLAGLNPSGVICEIMNDDGSMARLDDLKVFAKEHNLKIATIADLIAYRRSNEKLVECIASSDFTSSHGGDFKMHVYVNKVAYAEHVVLVKGDISDGKDVYVRMHAIDVLSDVLGDVYENKQGLLAKAMQKIEEKGRGVVVLLREPIKNMISNKIAARENESKGKKDLRDYGIGAQILLDLGIKSMVLLSNVERSIVALEGYDLKVNRIEKLV